MTDANEAGGTVMRKLDDAFVSDTDESNEEQTTGSSNEKAATDDIPPSLVSYFETSKSRAVACEKLILEDFEDFSTSYEDMMNLPIEFNEDMLKLNDQVNEQNVIEMENENPSTDTHRLHAPTETDMLFPHNVALCSRNEGQGETDEHMESAKHLAFKVRIPKTLVSEEEIKASSEHRGNKHIEDIRKEEQIRQRENNFQEELKKIIEAEKLHQMELQLVGKRAQEKIEQELLLQKELISNLQKRVEEERRKREDELKRIKEEEEKTNKEKEEKRRKKDEEEKRRIVEVRLKAGEDRRNNEDELKKKKEEEEKRKVVKDEKRKKEQKAKIGEEMRKEGEERKLDERKKIRLEEEENRRQLEEGERKKKEKEEEIQEKGKNKEREEEEKTQNRKEEKEMIELAGKRMEPVKKRRNKEEIIFQKDGKTRNEVDKRPEKELSEAIELEVRAWQQEMRKKREEQSKTEEEKAVKDKIMDEQMRRKEDNRKTEDEMQLKEKPEKTQTDVEGRYSMEKKDRIRTEEDKIKEKDWRKRQKEETKENKEEDYRKMEEEIRFKEGTKTHEAESRRVEHVRKPNDEEGRQDGMRKKEDGGINIEADRGHMKEEKMVKTEERRVKEEEESNMVIVQDTEKAERVMRANDPQQKKRENNSLTSEGEKMNTHNTGLSLTSQLEDSTTWPFSSPGPLHREFTANPTSCDISKSMDQPDAAVKPSSSSGSLPVCLPEHTEQKRLSWMKDCIPWSKLSLQNRRKQKGSVRRQRLPRRPSESLPPLCLDTLLQFTGWRSLQEVPTVTLEDLPGCNLSTLLQCTQLRSLTLRRCGLKSLEGISQLPELCYIDVEENDISFVDCENMTSLRVLRLGHNKLTSIHGLNGADNLDVLELSHNSITRIAGLESMRRLQSLSLDHNQLISTKGLRDIYTLLHLNCSYNHLASVEGLENSPLLNTLDLRANSLTEPPSLNNHVLLRELHLDDNSISSLQSLTACWLPLMQHLSAAQNRITQLPSMSDFISLAYLDLRFNCMSELQNVCESLEGCQFLQDVHLTGNPLQQESGWRSSLQKALPGLRAIDDQKTDSFLSLPAVQQIGLASVSFLSFCQAQLQQINNLQQQHSRELSKASSALDAMKSSCQHFTETLKLAENQRFAHEYGDITVSAGQIVGEKTVDMKSTNTERFTEHLPMESTEKVPPVISSTNNIRCSYWTFEEKPSTKTWRHTLDTVTAVPKTDLQSSATKKFSTYGKMTAPFGRQDLDLKNTAAVVIQQQWRRYRQKSGSISGPPVAEKEGGRGGDGENPESSSFNINGSTVDQHYAATVIQAFWRGCIVRKRLASALAAVTCPSTREDDTLEEVDVDEFVFDEVALEKHWTLQLSEDSPSRHDPVSEQPLSLKYTLPQPLVWKTKQAWVAGEEVDSVGLRVSPESSNRKSPASTSVLSGISERSEKILEEWGFTDSHTALLMLKRAQKMKSKQQQKNKHRDPSVRLALFRNCNYQLGPVEAQHRPTLHSRHYMNVYKTELGLQQSEKMEQERQEQAQQWLRTESDRDSESEHFLPEISPDILNGGRVQLVTDPVYTKRHHASGLWANSSSAAQPGKQNNYAHRISLSHASKDVPSPKGVTSAPSKKERISFRDNPVQLSGGWGGGKKRDKVYK